MTMPDHACFGAPGIKLQTPLSTGMTLNFRRLDSKRHEVSLGYMKAKERITLGIPLDLRFMHEEDWQALPGIGAKTAQDISQYRQKHGDFRSLEELKMVSGISEKKIEKMKGFFLNP
jgi:competence protein ComEA